MGSLLSKLVEIEKSRLDTEHGTITDLIYKWNLEDFTRYAVRDCGARTCVSVSDLVYCSNKYWLKQKYPELILADNLYAAWAVYGRLVHKGLEQLLEKHGFKLEYEVEKLYKIDLDGEKRVIGVTGRLDAIGSWNNKLTVVEIKSSRSDSELPKQHHILQLRIYMNMVNASNGILIYVTPDRVTEYYFDKPLSDEEIKILVRETILNTNHPRYQWECQYCPFNVMCPYKQTNNRFHKR